MHPRPQRRERIPEDPRGDPPGRPFHLLEHGLRHLQRQVVGGTGVVSGDKHLTTDDTKVVKPTRLGFAAKKPLLLREPVVDGPMERTEKMLQSICHSHAPGLAVAFDVQKRNVETIRDLKTGKT